MSIFGTSMHGFLAKHDLRYLSITASNDGNFDVTLTWSDEVSQTGLGCVYSIHGNLNSALSDAIKKAKEKRGEGFLDAALPEVSA